MKPGKDRKNGFVETDRTTGVKGGIKAKRVDDAYHSIVESTSDSLYMVDTNCRYVFMNQPHLLRLGLPKEKIIGKTYGELHSPERAKEFADRVGMVFDTGKSMQFEYRSERDGRYFLQTMSPVKENDPDGRITAVAVVSKDITEHRQAEELYKILTETSIAAVYIVQEGKFRFINSSAIAYAGYTAEELIGQYSDIIVHPEDKERVKKMAKEMLDGYRNAAFEFRMVTKQNEIRWISQTVTPIQYGGRTAILGNAMDITELREARIRLEEQKALQASILESIPQAVLGLRNRIIIFSNDDVEKIFGWKTEELIGKSIRVLYRTDEEYEKMGDIYMFLEKHKIDHEGAEFFYKHKDGRDILCRVRVSRIGEDLEDGKVVATFEDITELRRTEENLRAANQRLQDIVEFLPDATFVIDKEKKVIAWNRAIEEMTGVLKQDMIGRGDFAYSVPFYGQPRPIMIDLVEITDEEMRSKYTYLEKRGNTIYGEALAPVLHGGEGAHLWGMATPLFDAKGRLSGAIESIRDVTEQRRTEDQLKYLSNHDKLTGLYNRSFFDTEMGRFELGRHFPVGIIIADVDGLKVVNDNLGHAEGDKLLRSAAKLLKENLRKDDILARIGGDEFAVLQPSTDQQQTMLIVERIKKNSDKYNKKNSDGLFLSISLGAATAQKGDSLSNVLKMADEAMYREKALKKSVKKQDIE